MKLAMFAPLLAASVASVASADVNQNCHVVGVKLEPAADDLQIVAWIEDAAGKYAATVFITQGTGRFGLGNRPGRFDFNSGPTPPNKDNWPYGRRTTMFPVWAHKHGIVFPLVVFQDQQDSG